jgi:hypothetical protein
MKYGPASTFVPFHVSHFIMASICKTSHFMISRLRPVTNLSKVNKIQGGRWPAACGAGRPVGPAAVACVRGCRPHKWWLLLRRRGWRLRRTERRNSFFLEKIMNNKFVFIL